MRIAIVDESAARASIIEEGLAELDGCEIFVLTERKALLARIEDIAPDVVLIDLGNPSRDVLEEYFVVSQALARPIAMFVDEADDHSIAASIDAGVSAYVVDGLAAPRIRPLLDLAVTRFNAFARLAGRPGRSEGQACGARYDRSRQAHPDGQQAASRSPKPMPNCARRRCNPASGLPRLPMPWSPRMN